MDASREQATICSRCRCKNLGAIDLRAGKLHGPFQNSLEIGTAAGGTTRFIRELVTIERTVILDDGKHPRFPVWMNQNRQHVKGLTEFIGDSHSPEARQFLDSLATRFDLAAIDGDHSEEGVLADWKLVQPFLADGKRGIVWFHDTLCVPWRWRHCGVRLAANIRFCSKPMRSESASSNSDDKGRR